MSVAELLCSYLLKKIGLSIKAYEVEQLSSVSMEVKYEKCITTNQMCGKWFISLLTITKSYLRDIIPDKKANILVAPLLIKLLTKFFM